MPRSSSVSPESAPETQTKENPSHSKNLELLERFKDMEGELGDALRLFRRKVEQFEGLTRFSQLLNSSLDPAVVREKALEATCELLGCETASLFLIDRKKNELYFETALGEEGKRLQETVRLPLNAQSIAGHVAISGESLLINDVSSHPLHYKKHRKTTDSKSSFVTRTMLCVPLSTKGETIGVLQALNKVSEVDEKEEQSPKFSDENLDLLVTLAHQVAIAVENSLLFVRLKKSFYDTVQALAEAIEKKDQYTGGHTKRVVLYSLSIAQYLDLDKDEMDRMRLGAILHDVGKIGIEDKILKKKASLDPYEWPVMKRHPELGYQIMKRVEGLQDVIPAIRLHHERWDGKGYPLGLKGEEIPLIARVIAVADTYDAMVSTRPYRKGLSPEIAHQEINAHSGTQFCPRVVAAFNRAFEEDRMGKGSGGELIKLAHFRE